MENKIEVPSGIDVKVDDMAITVKGPKGELAKDFNNPMFNEDIEFKSEGSSVIIRTVSDKRKASAFAGTMAAHIRNMLTGVQDGFEYELKIIYTHFPITVTEKGGLIEVKNFLGEKGVRKARVAGECKVHIEKDSIKVSGPSVEDVGQTAANIEKSCKLKGRDRRIFQDGIYLVARRTQDGRVL